MLIGVRSPFTGKRISSIYKCRVVFPLWWRSCEIQIVFIDCFALFWIFFLTCCLNLEYDSASTTSFLFCQIPLEQQHNVFPVLSVAPSPEPGVYYSRNKSVIWPLLSKSWLTIFFFRFFLSFTLRALLPVIFFFDSFLSFLLYLPSSLPSLSLPSLCAPSILSSFLPPFHFYSQHFIFTLFISFTDFFLLCFFLFVLSSVCKKLLNQVCKKAPLY